MECAERITSTSTNILIVEDSPTQAEQLRCVLEEAGYTVMAAANGREALIAGRRRQPTLIISDIIMPEMDGFTLCKTIKSDESLKDIPVILLTSLANPHDIIKGLECGADNFIRKPYDEKYLLSRVQHILTNRELRKSEKVRMGIEIYFAGERHFITAERQQILDLLISTYEGAVRLNEELLAKQKELERANQSLNGLYWIAKGLNQAATERRAAELALEHALKLPDVRGGWIFLREGESGFRIAAVRGLPLQLKTALEREGDCLCRRQLLCGIMGIMADITEHKALEQQFRQAQKMEAVGRLAGGIAHDFNNMLTVITGYSEIILQSLAADDPQRGNVEQIKRAGEQAAGLTRKLLAFSRKQMLEPRVLDLNALVTNMEFMLQRLIGEHIELGAILKPGLGRVKVDPGQIEQVIMNLAVNARDAMPEGGRLTIETADVELDETCAHRHVAVTPGPHVMLAVSDTGCGMDAGTQARLFEPFFTTKEPGKGTGLGLSTVYGIVKQSGGNIWVYSEPGRGATFKIYLPRVEESIEAVTPERKAEESFRGSESILVVEDNEGVRALARTILSAHGYVVLEAADGDEALQIAQRHEGPIHLLVTDVVMPGMSGRESAERLASTRPDMKVLYLSGYTDEAIFRHGVLDLGTAFLQKPFTPDSLLRKAREVLDAKGT